MVKYTFLKNVIERITVKAFILFIFLLTYLQNVLKLSAQIQKGDRNTKNNCILSKKFLL